MGTRRTVGAFDLARLAKDLAGTAEWDTAQCALQAAWGQVAIAQAAADAARREAEVQTAAAAAARQQAAELTAGVNAYVDAALDRAEGILANARAEAARRIAAAEQQAEEVIAAARAGAVPTEVTPVAHARPYATFTDQPIMVIGAGATGDARALLTALDMKLSVPDDDHRMCVADALWQPTAVQAAGFSGAAVWKGLIRRARGLLTDPAGAVPGWTGPAAEAYRDRLAALGLLVEDLHEALRASAAASAPTRLTGSYRRSAQVSYPRRARQWELDLGVVFDEPDAFLTPHHDRPYPGTWRERLWTMVSPLGTCAIPTGLDIDIEINGEGEDRTNALAGVHVVDRSDAARRYVTVQVNRYGEEAGLMLRVPASTSVRSLLVLLTCAGAIPDLPSLPVPGPDELRNSGAGLARPLELEGSSCQAPPG
jgi:hypothetical protein